MKKQDTDLPHEVALYVARLIDHHDQPTTNRERRLEIQAVLREIFDAPTTATLSRARTVRRLCVAAGLYERPERVHELPAYLYHRRRKPIRSAPRLTT